jgi:hypothetical protein
MSKRTFFCFKAASGTLREDLRTFYCCRPHKFATKTFFCNTHYFYTVDSDTDHHYTKHTVAFPLQQCLRERASVTLYVHSLSCFICPTLFRLPDDNL